MIVTLIHSWISICGRGKKTVKFIQIYIYIVYIFLKNNLNLRTNSDIYLALERIRTQVELRSNVAKRGGSARSSAKSNESSSADSSKRKPTRRRDGNLQAAEGTQRLFGHFVRHLNGGLPIRRTVLVLSTFLALEQCYPRRRRQ